MYISTWLSNRNVTGQNMSALEERLCSCARNPYVITGNIDKAGVKNRPKNKEEHSQWSECL